MEHIDMTPAQAQRLLDALLDSWDRSNIGLLNLLRAIPTRALDAHAMPGSPTITEMFAHLHHERLVSVLENAPECADVMPQREWDPDPDTDRIAERLVDSGQRVRDAVRGRVEADRPLDRDFAHPVQLLQFLIFHDLYHRGQIKLALKAAGCPIPDDEAGPLVWHVWRAR